jgi:hypothetical protein
MSVLVLAGSAALALGGVGFGTWAWLGRTPASSPDEPAAVSIETPTMLLAPVPAVAEPPAPVDTADDPLIIDVDEDSAAGHAGDAREPSRQRARKKSTRGIAVSAPIPTPTTSPTPKPTSKPTPTEPHTRERRSERPNDLFPPSD